MNKKISNIKLALILMAICFILTGCTLEINTLNTTINNNVLNDIIYENIVENKVAEDVTITTSEKENLIDLSNIPNYTDESYVIINDNIPYFTEEDLKNAESYEDYSELDDLGRCGVAIANIGKDLMPSEERESIGQVKPSGWHTVKYAGIDGNYLYNRCHLIGFQLTGENSNKENLITGTRYLNVEGMLQFENKVADFVKENDMHVLYRVTPIFEEDNLLASGVLIEAKSLEDNGKSIQFNVYCYNVQPGITIDYKTGESTGPEFTGSSISSVNNTKTEAATTNYLYILNTSSKKIHLPTCSNALDIKEKNKTETNKSKDELIKEGYSTCGACKP